MNVRRTATAIIVALAAAASATLACTDNVPDQVNPDSPTAAVKATSQATRPAQTASIDTTPTSAAARDTTQTPTPRTEPTATPVLSPTPSPRLSTAFTVSKLTDHPHSDHMPTWSPDGSKVAYSSDSDRDGVREIHVINPDGSNVTQLTNPDQSDDHFATWSPDGSKIAFDRGWEIYVMNADGSDLTNLTPNADAHNYQPAWSPDGSKIAFTSDRDGDWDIYIMDTDGSNSKRITENRNDDDRPAWSPDGSKVAFTSDREGSQDIYVMDADGSNVQRVTRGSAVDQRPVWSPDGTKIAFQSNRDGDPGVFVIDADGSNVARITDSRPDGFGGPTWSPDGRFIAFEAVRNGNIYIVNVESLGVRPARPFIPVAATTPDDRAVLTAFYESTNGDSWSTNFGWTEADTPLDDWYGVTADGDGRVVGLDLTYNGLSGQIPESIGQLTELEFLFLSGNSLTGGLPDSIGGLRRLEYLSLSENSLSGSPPESMGGLRGLSTLLLFGSGLSGCLPGQLRYVLADGKTDVMFTPLSWCDQEHPKPMPETPASVTWHMGGSVPEPVRRAVRFAVQRLHEYAAQKGWPAAGEEVEVYVDDTPGLIDACRRRWPEQASRCAYLEGRGGLVIDRTAFVVDDVPDGNREIDRVLGVAETAVHESIHTSFQISVAGYDRDVAPWWFIEGMATYFAAAVEETYFPGRFNRHRDEWVREAGSSTAPLSSWENAESAPDPEADDGCWYECGALAIELLAYEFHVRSIGDFYTALNRNLLERLTDILNRRTAWTGPFEQTFGITADKFYETFERQRAAGFPELDPIR